MARRHVFLDPPAQCTRTRALDQMGSILEITAKHPSCKGETVHQLYNACAMFAQLKQLKVFYTDAGSPVGYICWGRIDEKTDQKLRTTEGSAAAFELNAGPIVHIFWLCTLPGYTAAAAAASRKLLLRSNGRVTWNRRTRGTTKFSSFRMSENRSMGSVE